MNYVTDKIIFLQDGRLYDAIGNTSKIEYDNLSEYNLSIILTSNPNRRYKKGLRITPKDYSIVLNNYKFSNYHQFSDELLKLMRYVEYAGCQYDIKRELVDRDIQVWKELNWVYNEGIRDGHISSRKFAELIEGYNKKHKKICRCYTIYSKTLYLNELIYDELFHAESRIIECINHQISNFNEIKGENLLKKEFEYASFSLNSDNASWCIQDSIKSLATSLDGISKLVYYLTECEEIPKKTPAKYFSDIGECIKKWDSCSAKSDALQMIDELKILTLFRNEVTHNRSLNSTRFPLFIGKGTSIINGLPLIYSDMFFGDHDRINFERSCNRVGFYSKKLNALTEIHRIFELVVQFIGLVMEYIADKLKEKLLQSNISTILFFDEHTKSLKSVDINKLESNL